MGENECGDPATTWVHDEDVEGDVEPGVGIGSAVAGEGLDWAGVSVMAGAPHRGRGRGVRGWRIRHRAAATASVSHPDEHAGLVYTT